MDFKDQIFQLAERVEKAKKDAKSEEGTKHSMIMPFLQCLGYDVFNPSEISPEFHADIGTKKGEKVDYAILIDGKPIIIIECKWWGDKLELHNTQLFRYFIATEVKFAVLTNGIEYQFYSDLEADNKMDQKPFLNFNITQMTDPLIVELKKFHKSYFDINEIRSTANELKYSNEVKKILRNDFKNPTSDFVKYFIHQIYPGRATESVISLFTDIVRKSVSHLIADMVNEKISAALSESDEKKNEPTVDEKDKIEESIEEEIPENRIVTTEEELEGYAIVKTILRGKGIDPGRIHWKDTINYFLIYCDDTTRRPICRLWFAAKKKYIGVFDKEKNETKNEVDSLDDIFKFEDVLFQTANSYPQQ